MDKGTERIKTNPVGMGGIRDGWVVFMLIVLYPIILPS